MRRAPAVIALAVASIVASNMLSAQNATGIAFCKDYLANNKSGEYAWRGYMLDVSRHFFKVDEIKKTIDAIALVGINVLHLHLTDNNGWRLNIDSYPRLTTVGSVRESSSLRTSTMSKHVMDGRYGPFFYTKEEMRGIVSYARARGIQVIPEIDLPGHSRAAVEVYSELRCNGTNRSNELCLGKDSTILFCEKVIDEVLELFPGEAIHMGGDECTQQHWKTCSDCQRRIRELHLRGEKGLQGWFMVRLAKYLERKGRRMVAWDDVVDFPNLPKSVIVMAYRRTKGYGQLAASKGYDVVSSVGMYLDFVQGLSGDPYEYQPFGYVCTWRKLLAKDLAAGYDVAARKHLLGGEACLWTELICDIAEAEWHTWPRLAAIGQMLTEGRSEDFEGFERRWRQLDSRLQDLGVNTARIGPLFDETIRLEPGVRCLCQREDFAKMLSNPLDASVLCFDWSNTKDKYRKVYAKRDARYASGSYMLDMDWMRIELTASDERGFANGLRQMRKLVRVKFGGVLEFPSCRIANGEMPRDLRTFDEMVVEKTFVTPTGNELVYRWHEPRHMLLGANYPLIVFWGSEADAVELMRVADVQNKPSFFCFLPKDVSDADVNLLVEDLKWNHRNVNANAVCIRGRSDNLQQCGKTILTSQDKECK